MIKQLFNYVNESRAELSKVTWPKPTQAIRLTLVVVLFSLVVAAFIGAIDYAFGQGLQKLILRV